MNKLGFLGLGSYSTLYYIQQLNEQYQSQKGGYSTCPFLMLNADFDTINPHLPDQFERLQQALLPYLQVFEQSNIKQLLVPNITLHQVLDQLWRTQKYSFELLHPLALAAQALRKQNTKTVIVLATAYTMQSDYISNFLHAYGVELLTPTASQIEQADQLRTTIYEQGISTKVQEDWQLLLATVADNVGILLACTELCMLTTTRVHVYNLAQLQLAAALDSLSI